MGACTRRTTLVTLIGVLTGGGCLGPELRYADEPPPDFGDDGNEFDASDFERILGFANDSLALLEEAADAFREWQESETSVDTDEIDEFRRSATGLLHTYGTVVAPHEETLVATRKGDSLNGTELGMDGEDVMDVLRAHDPQLVTVEDVTISFLDADGDPNAVSRAVHDRIEEFIETIEALAPATRSMLEHV